MNGPTFATPRSAKKATPPAEDADPGQQNKRAQSAAPVVHLTPPERAARGKAARVEVPRSSHAGWDAPPGRPDPVELLEEQAKSRVQELVPIRYGRMLASPFAFYRGAAYLMASDLASTPRSGLIVQACVTPTSRTSDCSPLLSESSCSTSTISMRQPTDRGNGT